MQKEKKIKVYYNSACPVCKAGISHQKNKSNQCEIDWNDVHSNNNYAQDVSENLELVRERLHVIDENNTLQIGIEAFIAIWQHSPSEQWKVGLLSLPVINPLANAAYNYFARLLYRWNLSKGHW